MLAHTALKIGSQYSFTPRKLRLFADFCLVWPSLADFSYEPSLSGVRINGAVMTVCHDILAEDGPT
jgi:hypothetical protein